MPATIEQWTSVMGKTRKKLVKFSGSHELIPYYNLAYKRAYELNVVDDVDYVHNYMCQNFGEDAYFDLLKYFVCRPTQKMAPTPHTPHTPKPQDELTFTKNYYGMITFSTISADSYNGKDKQTEKEAVEYLKDIYNKYMNPNTKKKIQKDFNANVWIEKVVSTNNVHMHMFYQREKAWLFVGSGWLKHGIDPRTNKYRPIKYNINNKPYKSDSNIIHAFNYQYNDSDSVILHKFENEIKSLS